MVNICVLLDNKKDLLALELVINNEEEHVNIKYPLILYKGNNTTRSKSKSKSKSNSVSTRSSKKSYKTSYKNIFTKMSFIKMRDYIKTNYNSKEFISGLKQFIENGFDPKIFLKWLLKELHTGYNSV